MGMKFQSINADSLDIEWIEQSDLYLQAAEEATDLKLDYDNAKLKVDRLRSQHYLAIKETPSDYGVDKVTENSIKAIIDGLVDVQITENILNEKRHLMGKAINMEKAYEMRKSALTKLTELSITGYYSEPKARMGNEGTKLHRDSISDNVTIKVGSNLNKNRKRNKNK